MNRMKIYKLTLAALLGTSCFVVVEADDDESYWEPSVQSGDTDGNGKINLTDVVFLANHLFAGGPAPAIPTCADPLIPSSGSSGDVDGSGTLNITDVVHLAEYLFSGGREPVEIFCLDDSWWDDDWWWGDDWWWDCC